MKRRMFVLLASLMVLGVLLGGAVPRALSSDGCCQVVETTCHWSAPDQCPPPAYCCSIVIDEFSSIFGPLCGVAEAPQETICTAAGTVGISLAPGDGRANYYVVGETLVYLAPGEIDLDLTGLCYGARRVEVVIEDTAGAGNTTVTALDAHGEVIAQASSTSCLEEVLSVNLCGSGYCGIASVKIEAERAFVKEIRILF